MALNLAFETVGAGPPLLVLHGLFGSSSNWRGVARRLAATHTVHSVDLRNHGASPWADSMDYAEMADDVLQLMDRLALKQSALLGHSMGGKTAMAVALGRPERVSRLVIVDIEPVSYADTLTPFAAALRSAGVTATANRAEVHTCLRQIVPESPVVPPLMQNLVGRNDHFDWRINLVGIGTAVDQLCGFPSRLLGARFEGPVTVLAGAHSSCITQHDGAAFRPMFSDIEVHVIPGAGHWVHVDRPVALVAHLQAALARDARTANRTEIQIQETA